MFGDFLHDNKRILIKITDIPRLENGTVLVARYNYREFQFGVYGNEHIIYQDCWLTNDGILVFSVEKCSVQDFSDDADIYIYEPDFDFDKEKTYYNAYSNYCEMRDKVFPASKGLRSVYGDDFTLMCMLDSIERFYAAFVNSRMGRHYTHSFRIAGIAPAYHHLLAIEEGFAVHFSEGDGNNPDIIIESLSHIENRAGTPLHEVRYNNEDVAARLLARNRALLIYSGRELHKNYDLFTNNCEHFVTLCKTGRSRSGQVRAFFQDALLVAVSVLARKPQYASIVLAKRLRLFT